VTRKKLVKLYHPDRFAHEETICVHLTPALSPSDAERENTKLTAAINRVKDSGDIQTLREIAEDPHGFILPRAGRASISAMRRKSASCGGCSRRCNWKSSA
jgi:hypothetical protein